MDVLGAAWAAAGKPPPTQLEHNGAGKCGRCGRLSELVATRGVVSRVFTAWDNWHDLAANGVCHACAWGYRHPPLRTAVHLVTTAPTFRPLMAAQLHAVLSSPLPPAMAVIVPLRPGRKHLIPEAGWGRVTVDDARLPWSAGDADRLAAMTRLRQHGCGPRMLAEAAPPFGVIRRADPHTRAAMLADWDRLAPWRRNRQWLDVGLRATTTTPMEAAA